MERYLVQIDGTDERFRCPEDRTILEAMEAHGGKGIPVGCRNGGCGVCKIQLVSGTVSTRKMSRRHVSEEEQANGRCLACRVRPTSDIVLRVLGGYAAAIQSAGLPTEGSH